MFALLRTTSANEETMKPITKYSHPTVDKDRALWVVLESLKK